MSAPVAGGCVQELGGLASLPRAPAVSAVSEVLRRGLAAQEFGALLTAERVRGKGWRAGAVPAARSAVAQGGWRQMQCQDAWGWDGQPSGPHCTWLSESRAAACLMSGRGAL